MPVIPTVQAEKRCARCGGATVDRLQRHGLTDTFLRILRLHPYHCRRCYGKFYLTERKDSKPLSTHAGRHRSR